MIVLVPILVAVIVAIVLYFRKKPHDSKPEPSTTAKQAYRAYYTKYDLISNPKHYNRIAFRLVDDTPMFLDDNPYTSAYFQPLEREMLTDDDEVYCMVAVQSSLLGYDSHRKKQAKKAIVLLFHAEPFRKIGRLKMEFRLSWRVDNINYRVVVDRIMKCDQLESFVKQAMEEYDFEETY